MEELFTSENQIILIVLVAVLLLLVMSAAILIFFFFTRRKITQKELEKQALAIENQKKIIQETIITQEKERTRIAQDLHDDISSKLNIIHLNANMLQEKNLTLDHTIQIQKNIIETTNKTLKSAREIAHNLIPPILDKFGLKDAVKELCDSFNSSKSVAIIYELNYPKNYLTSIKELHLFRIIQELINNSIRHGKAKSINLNISIIENKLNLDYQDNGIGFDSKSIENKKGLGLTNIENRIDILLGVYTLESKFNNGFKIFISL